MHHELIVDNSVNNVDNEAIMSNQLPSDDYFIQLRTKIRNSGEAQAGISYGMYVILFGAMIQSGAITSETPTMLAYRFADYLVVSDGELSHMSFGEFHNAFGGEGAPSMTHVKPSAFSSMFADMGLAPTVEVSVPVKDEGYERYLELVRKIHEGQKTASDIGRALSTWKKVGKQLNSEIQEVIDDIQGSFELVGGSVDDESSPDV